MLLTLLNQIIPVSLWLTRCFSRNNRWFSSRKEGFSRTRLLYFPPERAELGTKRPPHRPIIYPSGCQASFGGAVNTAVFPCLSSLQTATKPPSVWRRTVKIQSLQWHALWIYTGEFITWLAISALFIQRRKQTEIWMQTTLYREACDSAVFTIPLLKLLYRQQEAPKDVRGPHYWTRCICWALTVEKNEMSLSCPLFLFIFCFYLFINKSISE